MHDLVYHGGGGFLHSEVYNMPVWLRKFHSSKINEFLKDKNKRIEEAQGNSNIGDDKKVLGPNITPTSDFNYKL